MFSVLFFAVWPCIYILDVFFAFILLVPCFVIQNWCLWKTWQAGRDREQVLKDPAVVEFTRHRKACFGWHIAFSFVALPLAVEGVELNLFIGSVMYVLSGLRVASGTFGLVYALHESRS